MSVIIVGAGVVGFQVANQLVEEGKDVTIIENDETVARYVSSRLDCMIIPGSGNDVDVLRKAGAQSAEYFIALTGSDEINMICCALVEAEFKIPNKLARVRNTQYMETQIQHYWGIDYLINPITEAVKHIVQQIDTGAQNYVMLFENLDIQIQRFLVRKGFPLAQKSISSLGEMLPASFIVPVIQRNADIIIPDGSTVILEGDEIYIAAKEADFEKIHIHLGGKTPSPKKILLVGAGSLGLLVLRHLFRLSGQDDGFFKRLTHIMKRKNLRSVRVVERDYDKCKQISELFPEALVINADISEEKIFEEEGLKECDLLITATENTELNIITSLYARTIGIDSAITLVRSENYTRIAKDLGLNVTVSLKNTVINSIIRYLLKGTITSIQSQGIIDFLEFQVGVSSQVIGVKLKDVPLPLETILLYIKRNEETFIPDGDSTIKGGDHILILARKEHVSRIEKLLNSREQE